MEYKVGDIVCIASKPDLWSGDTGGKYPLGGKIQFPFVGKIHKLVKKNDYTSVNISGYGFSLEDCTIRKATILEIEQYVKDNNCDINEILEICKNLYPIGTKVIPTSYDPATVYKIQTVKGIIQSFDKNSIGTNSNDGFLFVQGKFARIVEESKEELPFKVGDKFKFDSESFWYTISKIDKNSVYLKWRSSKYEESIESIERVKGWKSREDITWHSPVLKKEDFYNTKIDVSESPELSRLVQEKLFELGINWAGGKASYNKDRDYLYISNSGVIRYNNTKSYFEEDSSKQIYPQDLGININNQTINNNNNDTSKENTSKSISISKIQGFNQQITSSSGARGIGLTSSRSKITLGTVNKPNKVGLSTR